MSVTRAATTLRILAVLAVLAMLMAACGGGDPGAEETASPGATDGEGASGDPIVLGAYAGATGELQAFGSFEEEGWEIAEEHLNEDGGILGRPVEIVFRDTGSSKDEARSIMQGFVGDDRIVGVMGPTSSANAFASHPVAVEAGMPVVAISNNAEGVVEQGEYIHRISVPEGTLLPVVVQQIVDDLGVEKAAILHAQDDPFSEAGFQAFQTGLEDAGVEILNVVSYASATPDLGPQIRQLSEGDPDAVFVAAFAEDAGSFLRQARQGGLDVPVVGNASFNSPAQLEIAGDAAAGLIIGSQWWLNDPDEMNQRFVEDYRERFDRDPGNFSAMAYNGAYIIKEALEAGDDVSREGLQEALLSLDGYDYLGAPITFENRDSVTDDPIILMVQEPETTSFMEYDPAAFE